MKGIYEQKDCAKENTTLCMAKKLKNRMCFKNSFEARVAWNFTSALAKYVKKLMLVEDLGFLPLISGICPKYKVPSYHSETIIPAAAFLKNVADTALLLISGCVFHNNNTLILLTEHWNYCIG